MDNQRQPQARSGANPNDLEAGNRLIIAPADEEDVIDIGSLQNSILSPDGNSTHIELMSPGSENPFEEVSRVSATLYLEMKKCIKTRNL